MKKDYLSLTSESCNSPPRLNNGKIKTYTIGVAAFPEKQVNMPLSKFLKVISPISDEIHLITGINNIYSGFRLNNLFKYEIKSEKSDKNHMRRIIRHLYYEIKISLILLRISKNISFWIFYSGFMPLPMFFTKLANKESILLLASSPRYVSNVYNKIHSKLINFLHEINLKMPGRIIIYTPNLLNEWNLSKYYSKILIAPEHFIDFDIFEIYNKFDDRKKLVGYVGRLSKEKGVMNFIKAIPKILNMDDKIKFMIIGDGPLKSKIEKYLDENNLEGKVKLAGWIKHDDLVEYLNELKLIVLPSYTEGLPNIMLEAMACGTPVLATSVGAIPDIIKDEETGFLMKNNTSECITENITRVLNYPDLEQITKNARKLVKREFTYNTAVDNYRMALSNIIRMP